MYNQKAVQQAIDEDKSISKKEAKLIHALLKGRKPRKILGMLTRISDGGWSTILTHNMKRK